MLCGCVIPSALIREILGDEEPSIGKSWVEQNMGQGIGKPGLWQ